MGESGDSPIATPAASSEPSDDRPEDAEKPVAHDDEAARAEGAQHRGLLVGLLDLARDDLRRDQQDREHGNDAEHGQGDRLGLHGAVDLPLDDRGEVKAVVDGLRDGPDDLVLDGRDPASAIGQLEPVIHILRPGAERPRQRRGEQHEGRVAVDVIQHHVTIPVSLMPSRRSGFDVGDWALV